MGLATSYVVCADPIYKPAEASRKWVKAHGWKMLEIAAGYDAMVIARYGYRTRSPRQPA